MESDLEKFQVNLWDFIRNLHRKAIGNRNSHILLADGLVHLSRSYGGIGIKLSHPVSASCRSRVL